MNDLSSLIERIEKSGGRKLPPTALATLPFVPGYPGANWFDIIEAAPKNRRGLSQPFRHAIRPLLELGLIAKNQRPRDDDGRLPFSLYHITPLGRDVLKARTPPMKDEATPEQLAMARRIAEKVGRRLHVNDANRLYDMEQSALAAIIETQRLCAELVEWMGDDDPRFAERAATAIRAGNHYGKGEE